MGNRDKKELGEVFLSNQDYFQTGLCDWAENLWADDLISLDELDWFREFLNNQYPKEDFSETYIWKPEVIEPRIEWIKKKLL